MKMDFTSLLHLKHLFSRKGRLLAGLDIGTSTVKVLEITKPGDNFCLSSYGTASFPENTVVDKEIKEVEVLADAVVLAKRRAKLTASGLSMAMPTSMVITKIISMDANLDEDDLESQLQVTANRYIPYPLEEVSFDFNVLGSNEKDEHKVDVLIAASRTEHVDARVDAVQEAGLPVRVVDVECYALERVLPLVAHQLPNEGVDTSVAIVNIGAIESSLTVMDNLSMIYTREEAFGGKQLTEQIAQRLDIPFEQAEIAKKEGSIPAEVAEEVYATFNETLAMQIDNALRFYESSGDSDRVNHILLTGGTAALPGLVEAIQKNIGITASVADPFANMDIGRGVNIRQLKKDAPSLLVACGLALRSFIH
jgi:type IV pilus assembly protein PilM